MSRPLPVALTAAGGFLLLAGLTASVPALAGLLGPLAPVSSGFGLYKAVLLAAGFALAALGRWVGTDTGSAQFTAWRTRPLTQRGDDGRFGVLAAELVLFLMAVRQLSVETPAFTDLVVPLIVIGFALHWVTPRPYRLGQFLLLSASAIVLVLGPRDGLWLLGLGTLLLVLAHLPLPFGLRVMLVIAAGGGLAALRVGAAATPWSRAVWPILGSMFMFRMIVYLYDLRHEKERAGPVQRLAYFFLLPNVVFPLFPVVDWAAFRRTYYDADAHVIAQRGIHWMVRGVLQLLAYRIVYQYFALAPDAVLHPAQLVQFLLATFFLYLRVSGQFHLIVGLLHLFGFHLPETHKKYFLAASFTDFWRRINIYWKDFMMKVFYYPAYFRLKRRGGERFALVAATLLVFACTWALHSYQWFWLLGRFPVSAPDLVFWGALAALLVWNSLREVRRGRQRTLRAPAVTTGGLVRRAGLVAGTFAVMCVLWSLWMSPTVSDWLAMWGAALHGAASRQTVGLALAVGITGAGGVAGRRVRLPRLPDSFAFSAAASAATLAGLLIATDPGVAARLGRGPAGVAARVREAGLNKQDLARMQRGYYEDLMGVSRFNSQLWEIYMRRPPEAAWPQIWETPAGRLTGDFLDHALRPSARVNYLGSAFTTNRWGMRDQEYALAKPPGTVRLALLGASVEMGHGVADGETFEAVAERLLNASPRGAGQRVQILDFAVAAYTLPQQVEILDRVFGFAPDVVMLATHGRDDPGEAAAYLLKKARQDVLPPFDPLRRFTTDAVAGGATDPVALRRLMARADSITAWALDSIARRARAQGARAVLLYVPMPNGTESSGSPRLVSLARRAGFQVLDLSRAYAGMDPRALQFTSYDYHPNALGHRLLGALLARQLADSVLARARPLPDTVALREGK